MGQETTCNQSFCPFSTLPMKEMEIGFVLSMEVWKLPSLNHFVLQ